MPQFLTGKGTLPLTICSTLLTLLHKTHWAERKAILGSGVHLSVKRILIGIPIKDLKTVMDNWPKH
jgi:hypothetical protein